VRAAGRRGPARKRGSRAEAVLGVDLGASKVAAALVDPRGDPLARAVRLVRTSAGPSAVLEDVVEAVRECLRGSSRPAVAAGIGVAGQVDSTTGVVRFAPNLAWRDVPLGSRLSKAIGVPVVVANDVRAATVGEWRSGAGRDCSELVCVFVGTGIGGSVVSGGRLLGGCANAAGEIGHTTVVAGGRPCHCPNRGCLEAYAGGWAIAERAREACASEAAAGRWLVERAGGLEAITAATVADGYRESDPLATRLVTETGEYLSAGVVGIVNAYNPCRLLLGGGVLDHLHRALLPVVRRSVRERCQPPAARSVEIRRAALGPDAGVIGAAWLARERHAGASA
jgi:glucokinase